MKILVLGSTGMLGHQLVKSLQPKHEIITAPFWRFAAENCMRDMASILIQHKVDVVVNCAGIVKQRRVSPAEMIAVNSILSHRLAELTQKYKARLIHFSTDCVFSGRRGSYTENDEPDPQDLYGRTKLLGEVYDQGCITLRTSLIGRELPSKSHYGLVEWALDEWARNKLVHGYNESFFSGVTTIEMARIIELVLNSPSSHGVWHVGGPGISKADLLWFIQKHYQLSKAVVLEDTPKCDRRLNSTRFQRYFGYTPPSWDDMIKEMANAER